MYSKKKLLLLSVSLLALQPFFGCVPPAQQQANDEVSQRRVPVLNPGGDPDALRQAPLENSDVTIQSAPVTPVQVTNAPPATAYPSLAGVPPAPTVPSKDNIKSDFSALNTQQQNAEANRNTLMNDQSATVMTSPQTGQLVANPAEAVAPAAQAPVPPVMADASAVQSAQNTTATPADNSQQSGFTGWLNHMIAAVKKPFTGDSNQPPAETINVTAPAVPTPIAAQPGPEPLVTTPVAPEVAAAPSPTPVAPEPAAVTPSAAVNNAPAAADASYQPIVSAPPAPAAQPVASAPVSAPAPVAAPATTTASVQPSAPAINSSSLPDISQLSQHNEAPVVNLVQPNDSLGNAYLEDSRYATHN